MYTSESLQRNVIYEYVDQSVLDRVVTTKDSLILMSYLCISFQDDVLLFFLWKKC